MAFKVGEITKFRVLPSDPSERRLWVVSSLAGSLDKLEEAISEIETHKNFCQEDKVIFMGGFIGDSLDNKKIIQTLRDYQKERPEQVVILRGAEEHRFLSSKKSFYTTFLGTCIRDSYRKNIWGNLFQCDVHKLVEDRNWILTLPSIYKTNRFFFVHCGVTTNQKLADQSPIVSMFLYDTSFIKDETQYEKIIVHTHTSNEFKRTRIGINSGLIVLNDTNSKDKILEINA